MNKKRLLRLADFVKTIPPESFRMACYGDLTPSCEFVGCALGWSAREKIFRGMTISKGMIQYGTPRSAIVVSGIGVPGKLFGLSLAESLYLFSTEWKWYDPNKLEPTPRRVAARIKKFVKTGKMPEEGRIWS
jgi:hypothetical protein